MIQLKPVLLEAERFSTCTWDFILEIDINPKDR